MTPVNLKFAQSDQNAPATPAMPAGDWLEFAGYLTRKGAITGDLLSKFAPEQGSARS